MKTLRILLILGLFFALAPADAVYLRVNQIGYLPGSSKIGLAMTNDNLAGGAFSVVNENGAVVFSGTTGKDRGNYGSFAHVYELDFTTLSAPGHYRLDLGGTRSQPFSIGRDTYKPLVPLTLQFFHVQRCGNTNPLKHGPCHLKDGKTTDGRTIDASGGWHDAGDYLKFLITTGGGLDMILSAYHRNPQAFSDSDGDGVPDVLKEARVGLDWVKKLWDPSRSILYYQVGDASDHDTWRMPERDDVRFPPRKVWPCLPGKGANVAGKAAAAFALASVIWGDSSKPYHDAALASTYLTAAKQIYEFGKLRPIAQSSTSGFYEESSWKDDLALAGAELYRATRDPKYLEDARRYAMASGIPYTFGYTELHALAHYEIAILDPSYKSIAAAKLTQDLDAAVEYAGTNSFHAAVAPFYWGSNEAIMGAAIEAFLYQDLTGNTKYGTLAATQIDFVLGANPWDVCWVGRAGSRWPHNPHHQIADLTHTELAGFWDEGPVARNIWRTQGIRLRGSDPLAAFQSDAALYHDDVEDYVTNEPTISANSVGLTLLSWLIP